MVSSSSLGSLGRRWWQDIEVDQPPLRVIPVERSTTVIWPPYIPIEHEVRDHQEGGAGPHRGRLDRPGGRHRDGARRLRECAAGHYQPLLIWFLAAFLMITDKRGVSALGIQRQLGIARYETAWMILHELRRATVNLERTPLTGEVEVDEPWVGGYQPGGKGRMRKGRRAALVVLALEVGNTTPNASRHDSFPTTPRPRSSGS